MDNKLEKVIVNSVRTIILIISIFMIHKRDYEN